MNEPEWELLRERMVRTQLAGRGIESQRVLDAMRRVPRHVFVPVEQRRFAYDDCALPIGFEQTISQPYIVALMSSLLELQGTEKILEVGSGSGYQAAVLAELAAEVHTIERLPQLASRAKQTLASLGYDRVTVHQGDGTAGLARLAPFDGILVAASSPRVPKPLLAQLNDPGRLVIPVGSRHLQYLEVWVRRGDQFVSKENIPVAFVPLIGEHGWQDD
jgi:protein-L-isoaspartate(D-aspartate) O-methyltransferase